MNTYDNIPRCADPIDPNSIYFRCLYSSTFFGPFRDEDEVIAAIRILDERDPMWDYDPFCLIYGANPLPKDYVFGFKSIPDDMKKRIHSARIDKSQEIARLMARTKRVV